MGQWFDFYFYTNVGRSYALIGVIYLAKFLQARGLEYCLEADCYYKQHNNHQQRRTHFSCDSRSLTEEIYVYSLINSDGRSEVSCKRSTKTPIPSCSAGRTA
jgi:hypothetical protein